MAKNDTRFSYRLYFDLALIIGFGITALWAGYVFATKSALEDHTESHMARLHDDRVTTAILLQSSSVMTDFLSVVGEASPSLQAPRPWRFDNKAFADEYTKADFIRMSSDTSLARLKFIREHYTDVWRLLERHLKKPVVVVYGEDMLYFDSGRDVPNRTPRTSATINLIKQTCLQQVERGYNFINIEGHTDDRPLRPGSAFKDNWELSAARAVTIARIVDLHLAQNGHVRNRDYIVVASGFAEYRPVRPNDIETNRQHNRRIEMTFLYREL